jgi:PleD family two-component response regulator
MPPLDGFELGRRMLFRAPKFRYPIPGMNTSADRAEAFSPGANDLITEPISSGNWRGGCACISNTAG